MASLVQAITPVRVTGGSTALVPAQSGKKTQITSLHLQNAGSVQTEFILYDGSSERWRCLIYPGQHIHRTGSQARPVIPLDQMTANTAVNGGLSDGVGAKGVLVNLEYNYADAYAEGGGGA